MTPHTAALSRDTTYEDAPACGWMELGPALFCFAPSWRIRTGVRSTSAAAPVGFQSRPDLSRTRTRLRGGTASRTRCVVCIGVRPCAQDATRLTRREACVCVRVCVCVRARVCVFAHTHTHSHIRAHTHAHAPVHTCACIQHLYACAGSTAPEDVASTLMSTWRSAVGGGGGQGRERAGGRERSRYTTL